MASIFAAIISSLQNINSYIHGHIYFAIVYYLICNLCCIPQAYETMNWRATVEEYPSRKDSSLVQREGSAEVGRAEKAIATAQPTVVVGWGSNYLLQHNKLCQT